MFSLVKLPSEKKKIFRALIDQKEVLLLKGSDESLCRLSPENFSKENAWLSCTLVEGKLEGFSQQVQTEPHFVNFAVGDERYFFQTNIQMRDGDILLETKVDLYHLQRRKSVRLDIPDEMNATCTIINLNGFSGLYVCHIKDYSSGGLRLEYQAGKPEFLVGDAIICVIRLGHRSSFQLEAEIRHQFDPSAHQGSQIFGIEFKNVEKITHNKLVSLQLDLQSEIFRKWKKYQY